MIRQSTPADLDRIMELWLNGNLEAHNFVSADYWKTNFEFVREAIKEGVTVFEEQGEMKGFIGIRDGYIAGLFVDKKSQGRGIGKKLVEYEKSREHSLTLDVFVENEAAVKFYKKQGFKVVEKKPNSDIKHLEYKMRWVKLP